MRADPIVPNRREALAACGGELLLAAWFLWPLAEPQRAPGPILVAVIKAWVAFVAVRALASQLARATRAGATVELLLAFALAFALSLGVDLVAARVLDAGPVADALAPRAAAADAFFCTAALLTARLLAR